MLCCLTEPSVTIHSWSSGRGRVIVFVEVSALCALLKAAQRSSDHISLSLACHPATAPSNGDIRLEQSGITREKTLKAPMNDFNPPILSGVEQVERVATR